MISFGRGVLLFSLVLVAAAAAILAVAAVTSWWVLLALIPLAMAVGCMAMMAARGRTPGAMSEVRCGCWGAGYPASSTDPRSPLSQRSADATDLCPDSGSAPTGGTAHL